MRWCVYSLLMLLALIAPAEAALTGWSGSNYLRRLSQIFNNVTGKPFLLSGWGYQTAAANRNLLTIGTTGGSTNSSTLEVLLSGPNAIARERDASTNGGASRGTVPLDTWFHLAGTYQSTTDRNTYLDGTDGSHNTTSVTITASDSAYVGVSGGTGNPWDGSGGIAELSGWSCCANETDRDSLATKLAGGDNPVAVNAEASVAWTGTLLFYWRLTDATDLNDLGPSGTHDLEMVGTLTAFGSHPPVDAVPAAGSRRIIIINQRFGFPEPKEWFNAGYRHLITGR